MDTKNYGDGSESFLIKFSACKNRVNLVREKTASTGIRLVLSSGLIVFISLFVEQVTGFHRFLQAESFKGSTNYSRIF
jgi:hypothetical protein